MASTRRPVEAIDYAKRFIKNMPIEQVSTQLINRVSDYMWTYAPWRWTIGSLPTFNLTNNTQDYSIVYPADFLYALRATISDGAKTERSLEIIPSLETNVGFIGQPSQIAFIGGGTVRVSPKPATVVGTQTVIGLYKKLRTPYTNQTIFTGTMPFDDEWFPVFEEGVLWQAYLYADDQRSGSVQTSIKGGQAQFTGQRAVFEAALEGMRMREPIPLINPMKADGKDWEK